MESVHELRQVEVDDRVLIEVFLKRWVFGNLQVGEKFARLTRFVIIGAKHLRRHRLSEAAAAAHTGEGLLRKERVIDNGDKTRLIDIFTIAGSAEALVPGVDVDSHGGAVLVCVSKFRQNFGFISQSDKEIASSLEENCKCRAESK